MEPRIYISTSTAQLGCRFAIPPPWILLRLLALFWSQTQLNCLEKLLGYDLSFLVLGPTDISVESRFACMCVLPFVDDIFTALAEDLQGFCIFFRERKGVCNNQAYW